MERTTVRLKYSMQTVFHKISVWRSFSFINGNVQYFLNVPDLFKTFIGGSLDVRVSFDWREWFYIIHWMLHSCVNIGKLTWKKFYRLWNHQELLLLHNIHPHQLVIALCGRKMSEGWNQFQIGHLKMSFGITHKVIFSRKRKSYEK